MHNRVQDQVVVLAPVLLNWRAHRRVFELQQFPRISLRQHATGPLTQRWSARETHRPPLQTA